MNLFAGAVLTIMVLGGSAFADAESFEKPKPNPQVILLSNPPRKSAWYPGITLGKLLMEGGGTSQSFAFIVRNGVAEKIKLVESLNRVLEPWDIVVVGYQPGPSASPQPASSPAALPKS